MAANRGASGIDGVLSTAAGWAEGLGRGATLVVGDVSFLHDVNGLNLLRTAELRPPLTVRRSLRPYQPCVLQPWDFFVSRVFSWPQEV